MFNWLFGKRKKPEPVKAPVPAARPVVDLEAAKREAERARSLEAAVWQSRLQKALGDDGALLSVARETNSVEIKLAAVAALDSDDALRLAEREFRSHDRRVHQVAKRRLGEALARRDARQRADGLIAAASALAGEAVIPANRLVQIDRDWSAIDAALLDDGRKTAFADWSTRLAARARDQADRRRDLDRWSAQADLFVAGWSPLAQRLAQGDAGQSELDAAVAQAQALLQSRPDVGAVVGDDARTRVHATLRQAEQIGARLALLAEWAQWPAPVAAAPVQRDGVAAPADGEDAPAAAPAHAVEVAGTTVESSAGLMVDQALAAASPAAISEVESVVAGEAQAEPVLGQTDADSAEAAEPEPASNAIAAMSAPVVEGEASADAEPASAAPTNVLPADPEAATLAAPAAPADVPAETKPAALADSADSAPTPSPAAVTSSAPATAAPAPADPQALWQALPALADKSLAAALDSRFRQWQQSRVIAARATERPPAPPRREREAPPARAPSVKALAVDLETPLQQAEAALEAGHVAQAATVLAAIERAIGGEANAAPENQRGRIHALRAEVGRMKAWQQWGGERARDDLVAQAETLAAQVGAADDAGRADLAIRAHAEAIDDLRKRWREVDRTGAAAAQPLWLRFDAALKTAFQPVAAHREKLDAARRDNLAAREALLTALAAVGLDGSNALAQRVDDEDPGSTPGGDEAALPGQAAAGAEGGEPAPAGAADPTASATESPPANGDEAAALAGSAAPGVDKLPDVAATAATAAPAATPESSASANGESPAEGTAEPADTAADAPAPNWRAVALALDNFQREWRKLGPVEHTVPHAARDALIERLRSGIARLADPLQAARQAAQTAREDLIGRARDAAERMAADPQSRDIVAEVRDLQANWQYQARTMRLAAGAENALWKDFKAATDAVFALRDAAIAERGSQWAANHAARVELIARLEALDGQASAALVRQTLADVEAQWRVAGEVARADFAALESRFGRAHEAALLHLADGARRAWLGVCDALSARIALCEAREDVAAAADAAPEAGAEIESRWAAQAALAPRWEQALVQRWQAAAAPSATASGDAAALDNILLRLESLLALPSPAPFQAARREMKLHALKASLEQRRAPAERFAEIDPLVVQAIAWSPTSAEQRDRLHAVIKGLRESAPSVPVSSAAGGRGRDGREGQGKRR
jgi:hypothetical protein